ncbi:MAG: MATE family efflux transporter [Oscillospiraceae bacterium]|nr:MATE family efflux transporter [Oscillospiraceae bacterium]
MTRGDVLGGLLAFSVPSLIGNLLHQVYSLTDSIVVGRILGMEALAAVGCTLPLILLLAALMIGTNIGVGVLLSQAFGAKDMPRMRRGFLNSLYVGLGISLVLAVVGVPLSKPILVLMGTPEGPLQNAVAYLRINFITSFCPMAYYLFSCAFRGMGDSRTDLYCLIVSVSTNVVLDILFVAVFRWGVAGSAWATALAQLGSAVVAAVLLFRKYPVMRPARADLMPDRKLIAQIGRLSVPIAAQSAFNNIGNLVAQGAVNGFGAVVMAAYTAAGRVGAFALMPLETVGNTLSIFVGQNYGAGKTERIDEGRRVALRLQLLLSTVLGLLLILFGKPVTRLFLADASEELLKVSYAYLLITAAPGFLAGLMFTYQQLLRGMGDTRASMRGGVIQLVSKVAVIALGAQVLKSLNALWAAWPVSFAAATLYLYWHMKKKNVLSVEG